MGYHTRKIEKGVYGELSKIREELEEAEDAEKQDANLLLLCELADLYGALQGYLEARFGEAVTMNDLAKMAHLTGTAFEEGERS